MMMLEYSSSFFIVKCAFLTNALQNRRVDLKDRGAAEGRTSPDDKTASMAEHQDGLKYKFKRKKRCASIAEQTLPTILE